MGVTEIFESTIPCLSSIIDLQRACQQEKVRFSPETNQYLLYLTLKKVGPFVAQKLVSKLVEKGEIKWNDDENWEVERIIDHIEEDDKIFYLIKWKGWSNAHNSWEPRGNLECEDFLKEYHSKGRKRRLMEMDQMEPHSKRNRVDEIFHKLAPLKEKLSPMGLLSLSSPTKSGKQPLFKGLVSNTGRPSKTLTPGMKQLNPRSKFYKQKKLEVKIALNEWQSKLNSINTDPSPITVENDVDLEGPPENFEYINDYRAGEGITIPDDPMIGCDCEDCLENKKNCCPTQSGSCFAYYKGKRVRVPRGTPIYECNKRCKCGPECANRVVQQGRKFKVCVFRTANGRGWGVKTQQKIKKGSFVVEYVGEVITNEEAENRGRYYDAVGRTYLFDLDYNDGDCPFTVDAGYYGNVSHFINHSCDPNLEVFGVWINTLDPRLPRIALFSKRDIEKGEELTFDYMMTGDTTNQAPTLDDVDQNVADVLIKATADTEVDENDGVVTENETEAETETETSDEMEETDEKEETEDDTSDDKVVGNENQETQDTMETVPAAKKPEEIKVNPVVKAANALPPGKLLPKSITDQYKIVCQCGAKNCRKYLF